MDISTLQSKLDFIKSLYLLKEWKDKHCRDTILEAIKECNAKIEKAFGISMHRLEMHKPSIEAVGKVVRKFPSTLSFPNSSGSIPIQYAAGSGGAFEYVPSLAKEGVKHKVGGEDARGGLLMIDPYENKGWNTFQWFFAVRPGNEEYEAKMDVLNKLRKLGLFKKEDIQEQVLLTFLCCFKNSKLYFNYLVDWDPDALLEISPRALTVLKEETLFMTLKSGFDYHPSIGGLLFVKDDGGMTIFDAICETQGTEQVMNVLHQILSTKYDFPILHHVFTKAPQHKELFMKYFPWATQLKDHNGRSLQQAVLAAGPNVMNDHDYLFAMLTDNQVQERDPVTTLYPFAAMAVGEHADLKKSFYLLRRHPSVLEKRSRASMSGRRKKRKIEDIED